MVRHISPLSIDCTDCGRVDDVELPNVHPKKAFIIDALDKEIRLSFAQRIKGTLPEPYQPLISTAKEKDTPDFKYNDETTPFFAQGQEIAQLIRKKATDEELTPVLQKIEDEANASGLSEPQLASTDALVTSICYVGSKSLSHALACVERCKGRLMTIANTSHATRKQIITSVMEYWKHQAGVGATIIDKLLNYQILTPGAVVEWALIDKVDRGTALAQSWCYELVNGTTTKVAGRVRSIVRAIRRPGMPEEQKSALQSTLQDEIESMKNLFAMVEDALVPIRDGNQDEMMESSDALREEEEALLKAWGAKWVRVFSRRARVEESWIREELAKPIPEVKVEEVTMEDRADAEAAHKKVKTDDAGVDGVDAIE